MHDVLEQVDSFLDEPVEEDNGQEIFDRVVDFIIELEPDSLSDDQLEEVMEILDHLEFEEELEEKKQTRRPKLANKTPIEKKQYSRQYTRKNRTRINSDSLCTFFVKWTKRKSGTIESYCKK